MRLAEPAILGRLQCWIMAIAAALLFTGPAQADPADIAASSRSVVRIVLVAQENGKVYYIGHGSGFAVSPDKVVTNAHVVRPVQEDSTVLIGIIPSQGSKSFGGKLLAVSPRNDLALIQLQEGRLPPVAVYGAAVADGTDVVAIGYPGAVDRAQGLSLDQLIEPMAPVKTPGVVSGGRTSREFDTLLHTAPLAAGNSGGPLVDNCGRVVGVNSFGSLSDGNDAEFGFAVSNRELAGFLRAAKISYSNVATDCRSAADLSAEEAERNRLAMREQQEQRAASKAAEEARYQRELRKAELEIENSRENRIAIAALLLALAVLSGGAGGLLLDKGKRNPGIAACSGGAVLLLGAALIFLTRPSLADAEDIATERMEQGSKDKAETGKPLAGPLVCRIIPERSRITLSEVEPLEIDWNANGCVNKRTQYGRETNEWSRVFVPNSEDTVSINHFDPDLREFRTERFLLDIPTMQKAREIRARYRYDQCTGETEVLSELVDMQKALRAALPAQPNEILVYQCDLDKAGAEAAAE
ncbi:MAG: trypsin-like peptidase domain-containing protein [Blastomonas sp.]